MSANSMSLDQMASATPASRDRYVDFLRAISIAVVVVGHWLMAIVVWGDGGLDGANALEAIPGMWILTWVLQVMPVFFFVGGFSNLTSWKAAQRRHESYSTWLRTRVERLMKPTLVFVGIWTIASLVIAQVFPATAKDLGMAFALIAKPLWFLAVYVLVVALVPLMAALHERYELRVPIAMATGAIAVDVLRIAFDIPGVGYLNFAFVWLFAHQLGFFYADGSLTRLTRGRMARMALAGLVSLVALTTFGPYSNSMVGVASEKASNNSPPTICLIALSLWLIGLAMSFRTTMNRKLENPRLWVAVVAANSAIITVFLWHLTALLLAAVTLLPAGFPQPEAGSAMWWATRPLWIGVLIAFTAPFVLVFSRFERAALLKKPAPRETAAIAVGVGTALLVVGLSLLAQFGFDPTRDSTLTSPLVCATAAAVGYRLLKPTLTRSS